MLSDAIARSGFKVTLSGEGSDEVFGGYPHFQEDVICNADFTKKASDHVQKLYAQNDKLAGLFLSDGAALDAGALEKHLGFLPSFIKAKASLGFKIQSLLRDDYKVDVLRHNSFEHIAEHFDVKTNLLGRDALDQSSYLWTKLTLAGYILKTLGDGCEMAHSIEGRVPYLDHKLFEYVKNLPAHYKMRADDDGGLIEKYILRQAVRPYITDTLYNRRKHPFIAPPVSGSLALLHEKLGDILQSDIMNQQPFYTPGKVQAWFSDLRKLDAKKQLAQEPMMMMILTTLSLHKQFRLGG
jgi:asparagine synthase (glutamine-hydrolysing)